MPLDTPSAILHYFKAKLSEEATEVAHATTVEEMTEELADCLEVIVIDTITLAATNPAMSYYLQNPAKYPKVNAE